MTESDQPRVSRETTGSDDGDIKRSDGWDPDGLDLARAVVARGTAAGRSGAAPFRSRSPRPSAGRVAGSRRRSPGAGWSSPSADDRDPQSLGTTVDRLVGEHGWGTDIAVHGVIARWDQIVGPEIAAHIRPEGYAEGVLTVRADSTSWATQMRMLAADVVKRLNQSIGDGTVRSVT